MEPEFLGGLEEIRNATCEDAAMMKQPPSLPTEKECLTKWGPRCRQQVVYFSREVGGRRPLGYSFHDRQWNPHTRASSNSLAS